MYRADNILYTGEEMRKYYERKGIAAKGRTIFVASTHCHIISVEKKRLCGGGKKLIFFYLRDIFCK